MPYSLAVSDKLLPTKYLGGIALESERTSAPTSARSPSTTAVASVWIRVPSLSLPGPAPRTQIQNFSAEGCARTEVKAYGLSLVVLMNIPFVWTVWIRVSAINSTNMYSRTNTTNIWAEESLKFHNKSQTGISGPRPW